MTAPVTPAPSIHDQSPASLAASKKSQAQVVAQLQNIFLQLPQIILGEVVAFIKQETGIDLSGLLSIISPLTTDMSKVLSALEGIDLSNPGSILTAVAAPLQQFIDAIVEGGTGQTSTGNDPASVVFSLLGQAEKIPADLLQLLFGQQATQQAQITALQNNAGTALSDDFSLIGVSGYTNLVGTLAVSSRGPYIQSATEVVAYRNVGPATDKHGAHIVLGANMLGVCRVGISCDTAASNWAGLEIYSGFDGDALRIVTGASPTLVMPMAQLDLIGDTRLMSGDAFDFWYDQAANTFRVLRNTQPVLSWPDQTNIVSHNSSKRKILLTTNGFNQAKDSFYGPGISKVVAYDK